MRSCVVVWTEKSQVFWGRRGTFSGASPPRLSRSRPNFYTPRSLRSTLSLLSFIPSVEFWGSYAATPSFASLHYGLPYSIWQAILIISYVFKRLTFKTNKHIFTIFSPSGNHTILVFQIQTSWRYSDGYSPNEGVEWAG